MIGQKRQRLKEEAQNDQEACEHFVTKETLLITLFTFHEGETFYMLIVLRYLFYFLAFNLRNNRNKNSSVKNFKRNYKVTQSLSNRSIWSEN